MDSNSETLVSDSGVHVLSYPAPEMKMPSMSLIYYCPQTAVEEVEIGVGKETMKMKADQAHAAGITSTTTTIVEVSFSAVFCCADDPSVHIQYGVQLSDALLKK